MGQKQLLLLVLGIVLVGLAVAVGIEVFDHYSGTLAQDAEIGTSFDLGDD